MLLSLLVSPRSWLFQQGEPPRLSESESGSPVEGPGAAPLLPQQCAGRGRTEWNRILFHKTLSLSMWDKHIRAMCASVPSLCPPSHCIYPSWVEEFLNDKEGVQYCFLWSGRVELFWGWEWEGVVWSSRNNGCGCKGT